MRGSCLIAYARRVAKRESGSLMRYLSCISIRHLKNGYWSVLVRKAK